MLETWRKAFLLALLCLFVMPTASSLAITGGFSPKKAPEWAAIIYSKGEPGKNLRKRFHCSGTLISPNVVISAAHCGDAYSIELGSKRMGQHEEIKIINNHDAPSAGRFYSDATLFVLEKNVKNRFLPVINKNTRLKPGDMIKLFGYGDQPNKKFGILKGLTSVIQNRKKVCFSDNGFNACVTPYKQGGVCPGDSGGPGIVKINGRLAVAAITSGGGNAPRACARGSIDSINVARLSVPSVSTWLRQNLLKESAINPFIKSNKIYSPWNKQLLCRVPDNRDGIPAKKFKAKAIANNCRVDFKRTTVKARRLLPAKNQSWALSKATCKRNKQVILQPHSISSTPYEKGGRFYQTGQFMKRGSAIKVLKARC